MDEKTFKEMLEGITVENIREAHKIVGYIDEQITQEEGPQMSDNARGIMIATMLIEYGKLKGRETHERTE